MDLRFPLSEEKGGARAGQAAALPPWSPPAPGFRVGAKDKARLSVSLASFPSPQNVLDPEIWRRFSFWTSSLVITPDALRLSFH